MLAAERVGTRQGRGLWAGLEGWAGAGGDPPGGSGLLRADTSTWPVCCSRAVLAAGVGSPDRGRGPLFQALL